MGRGDPCTPDLSDPRRGPVGPRDPCHRRRPGRRCQSDGDRCPRQQLRVGIHALLRHELHVHGAGGCRRLPRAHVQYRRRGTSDARRSRCRDNLPLRALAALVDRAAGRHRHVGSLRRFVGRRSSLSAGQTRQPHRHHHDHVQLHRSCGSELRAGEPDAACRQHGSCDRPLSPKRSPAHLARHSRAAGHRILQGGPGQYLLSRGDPCLCAALAADLAHAHRLRDPCLWPFGKRRQIRRHFARQDHHDRDDHFRCACRNDGHQQRHGRSGTAGAQRHRRRRLHRDRGGSDGPQSPGGCVSCRDPLRVSLSGRRGTGALDVDPARTDRRHSGAGHPVHRCARQHGADAAGTGVPRSGCGGWAAEDRWTS